MCSNRRHTWFGTDLPFSPHSRSIATFRPAKRGSCGGSANHRRVATSNITCFPNFLCSFTDV